MVKEKFRALVAACKEDADMLDIISSDMLALSSYVDAVYMMEISIPIILARYEGEEVRDRIQELDRRRRMKHERAITAVKRLNRFAEMEQVNLIFSGDTSDRYAIADFCQACVNEFFSGRDGHHEVTLDRIMEPDVQLKQEESEREK